MIKSGVFSQILQRLQQQVMKSLKQRALDVAPQGTTTVEYEEAQTSPVGAPNQPTQPQPSSNYATTSMSILDRLTGQSSRPPPPQSEASIPPVSHGWGGTMQDEKRHNKVLMEGERHKRDAVKRALQSKLKKG